MDSGLYNFRWQGPGLIFQLLEVDDSWSGPNLTSPGPKEQDSDTPQDILNYAKAWVPTVLLAALFR